VIAAAPSPGRQNPARSSELSLEGVIPAAPVVVRQKPPASAAAPPSSNVLLALVNPAPAQIPAARTPQFATAPAVGQKAPATSVLQPMPDMAAAVPAGTNSTQSAPVVTYRDGQLTINAENVTLAAVLQLIAEKTGAVIEVPPGTAQERIFEHSGPAPANDVLERLLNGSPFNFIIVGSPQHPNQPAQVLLSLHGPDTPVVASAQPKPPSNPFLSTPPPEPAADAAVVPYAIDPRNFQPPKEPLSPEALSELMKERGRQLREALQKPE